VLPHRCATHWELPRIGVPFHPWDESLLNIIYIFQGI